MSSLFVAYALGDTPAEQRRLIAQAHSLEAHARSLLDHIKIKPGFRAVDVGCGPIGIMNLLSERVGPEAPPSIHSPRYGNDARSSPSRRTPRRRQTLRVGATRRASSDSAHRPEVLGAENTGVAPSARPPASSGRRSRLGCHPTAGDDRCFWNLLARCRRSRTNFPREPPRPLLTSKNYRPERWFMSACGPRRQSAAGRLGRFMTLSATSRICELAPMQSLIEYELSKFSSQTG